MKHLINKTSVEAMFAGMSLVAACIAALATAMPVWAAASIMTVVLGGTGTFLFFRGKARLRNFHAVPSRPWKP